MENEFENFFNSVFEIESRISCFFVVHVESRIFPNDSIIQEDTIYAGDISNKGLAKVVAPALNR